MAAVPLLPTTMVHTPAPSPDGWGWPALTEKQATLWRLQSKSHYLYFPVILLQLLSNRLQDRYWQRQYGSTCSKGQGKCGDSDFAEQQALGAPSWRWLPFAAPSVHVEKCTHPLKHHQLATWLPTQLNSVCFSVPMTISQLCPSSFACLLLLPVYQARTGVAKTLSILHSSVSSSLWVSRLNSNAFYQLPCWEGIVWLACSRSHWEAGKCYLLLICSLHTLSSEVVKSFQVVFPGANNVQSYQRGTGVCKVCYIGKVTLYPGEPWPWSKVDSWACSITGNPVRTWTSSLLLCPLFLWHLLIYKYISL